jgi:adenylate cyclase
MFRYQIFVFLIIMLFSQAARPGARDLQTDSLLLALNKKQADSTLFAEVYTHISGQIYNNPDSGNILAQKALSIARDLNDAYFISRFYMLVGVTYDLRGMYDSAFVMYDKGLEMAEKHQFSQLAGELHNNYGITLTVVGRLEESIGHTLKSRDIFESLADSAQLARIYNNLGSRYAELQLHEKALEFYMRAAEINERRQDFRRLGYNYGNIGLLYHGLNQNEKALEYFYSSLQLLDTTVNRYDYSIALHNLALAYQRLSKFETALNYEARSLAIARELSDEIGIINALTGKARIFYQMEQPQKALELYNQSEMIARRLGTPYYMMNIFEEKAIIYAGLIDFRNAFEFNQKYLKIKDSIMTVEKDKAFQRIKSIEDEQKQQQIQILTRDSEINSLILKRQKILRNSVAIVGFLILLLAIGLYSRFRYVRKTRNELAEKNKIINYEKSRSDDLLLNILPAETAEELKNTGSSEARYFDMVTVMFTDFKGFTKMAENLTPQELVSEIDHCFKAFDQIISKYNVEKIKTIGDAYMCAGGLPVPNNTNPFDVVLAALEIHQFMLDLKELKKNENKPYFELRLGIHTGPLVAGIVGTRKFQYDIWGDTVNIASRMESAGEVGRINVSHTTYGHIKDRFHCVYRGKIEAKNKGLVDMYFVETGLKTG